MSEWYRQKKKEKSGCKFCFCFLFVALWCVDDESLRTKRFRILVFNEADAPKYTQA